ncbi:unnamed protein product [Sphagnum troendelagicum]
MANSMMNKCTSTIENIHQRILESKEMLNQNQCEHLLMEFKRTLDIIKENLSQLTTCNEIVELLTYDLHQVVIKVNDMVEACYSNIHHVDGESLNWKPIAQDKLEDDQNQLSKRLESFLQDRHRRWCFFRRGSQSQLKLVQELMARMKGIILEQHDHGPSDVFMIDKHSLSCPTLLIPSKLTDVNIGTTTYRAPEMSSNDLPLHEPDKADVYSFGIMCSEILSGKAPFERVEKLKIQDEVKKGVRPKLPTNFNGLVSLINECWRLDACNRPSFQAIWIVGMGGIGKTTMAKALYDHIYHNFEAYCFMPNIKANKDTFQLLIDILQELGYAGKITNIVKGEEVLRHFFCTKKVFIILDDVRSQKQLDDILPIDLDFTNGSRIVMTSRNWNDLRNNVKEEGKFDMPYLDNNNAMELFEKYVANNQSESKEEFELVTSQIVKACGGLPLSLKVLGSYLRKETDLKIWQQALKKLQQAHSLDGRQNDEQLWGILRISFDELAEEEQSMFLDIVCFFCTNNNHSNMMTKATALRIWDDEKCSPELTLSTLVNMSLVQIASNGLFVVHDQLRDMGRMISNKEYEGSRWNVEAKKLTPQFLKVQMLDHNYILNHILVRLPECIKEMKSLTSLDVNRCDLDCLPQGMGRLEKLYKLILRENKRLVKLPDCIKEMKSLTSLDLDRCDLDCLPQGMGRLEKLSYLDLRHNKRLVKLPECIEEMKSLTSLDVSGCDLDCLPQGMGRLEKLSYLDLRDNKRLVKLPECIEEMKSLTSLHVSGCDLDCLPQGMGRLEKLSYLDLRDNKRLVKLPECIEEMKSLTRLDVSGCDLDCLLQGMGRLEKLSNLYLGNNKRLVKLPECIEEMKSLTSLDVNGCDLDCLPQGMGRLEKLSDLDLRDNKRLVKLPECIKEMKSLTRLHVGGCDLDCVPQGMGRLEKLSDLDLGNNKRLVKLPECIEEMNSLTSLDVSGCDLDGLPQRMGRLEKLSNLYLGNNKRLLKVPNCIEEMKSLTSLDVGGCDLDYLPQGMGRLQKLYQLILRDNKRLVKLPECIEEMKSLTSLDVGGCDLDCVPQGMGRLEKLSDLDLGNNRRLVKVPNCIEEMKSLTSLNVGGCDLDCLPQGMGRLQKLYQLILRDNKRLVKLPDCIKEMKSLTSLDLDGCDLDCLPQGIGRLEKLSNLYLGNNKRLVKLPECIEEMKSLTSLDVNGCDLDCLPQGMGRLEKLSDLDLRDNKRLVKLPECIEEMKSLTSLDVGGCDLDCLPQGMGRLENLSNLYLGNNKRLMKLPKCIEEMKSLEWLDVGIVGMGGIGKTTMAKALYDHIYHNFEAHCFMPNIKAKKDTFQLLIDILQELGYDGNITNIVKGEEVLRHFFCTKKMLIILDDVRCQQQLDDILPIDLDFTNGSRIIMTSRSWIGLRNNVKEEGKFDMPHLDNNNAMKLFQKYVANNQSERKEEFGLVTSQIVKACGGLPLSLKVLGSYLRKETDLKIWQQALKKLQQARSLDGRQNDEQLWGVLRISFDELGEEEKDMFLDTVCFFCTNNNHSNMMTKATTLRIWDDEHCSPEFTLSTLVNMSLVQITSDGLFVVHDQLRDMGRMISKKEYKGSRWNVEAKNLTPQFLKGLEHTQGLSIEGGEILNYDQDVMCIEGCEPPGDKLEKTT